MFIDETNSQAKKSKILIISQPDSIHTERFIASVRQRAPNAEIFLYPSNPFTYRNELGALCNGLVKHPNNSKEISGCFYYRQIAKHPMNELSGQPPHLAKAIQEIKPNFIHVNCIQDGGYLLSEALELTVTDWPFQTSLSIWGNDLFRFASNPSHKHLIAKLLKKVDVILPESQRDFQLARNFGFEGRLTRVVQATLTSDVLLKSFFHSTSYSHSGPIVIAANDEGGRAANAVAIMALVENLDLLRGKTIVYCGSVVDEIRLLAPMLNLKSLNVELINMLPQDQFFKLLEKAQIYISLTTSDGIPNSFLECCASHTYPVFSTCSAVNEWKMKDNVITIDPYDRQSASAIIRRLLCGQIDIKKATEINYDLLSKYSEKYIDGVVKDWLSMDFLSKNQVPALDNQAT